MLEGWETEERGHDVYGVVLTGRVENETLAVDEAATAKRRRQLGARAKGITAPGGRP